MIGSDAGTKKLRGGDAYSEEQVARFAGLVLS
jgi:hypothetical protein